MFSYRIVPQHFGQLGRTPEVSRKVKLWKDTVRTRLHSKGLFVPNDDVADCCWDYMIMKMFEDVNAGKPEDAESIPVAEEVLAETDPIKAADLYFSVMTR